jgi:hypothetical protein
MSEHGNRLRINVARPSPVTIEIRAHIPWMTAIMGVEMNVSHSSE